MMTNTYIPHVGGVARSVEAFTTEIRNRGHQVLVVAPEFENMPSAETDVIRLPAIQNFNGTDFSVVIPIPGFLNKALEKFKPDVVHSHHPFLVGSTALRVAHMLQLPLIFTHHTMYEQYTHYVPGDSIAMKRFAIKLTNSYANLCDQVIAPSESIADTLRNRSCLAPITVIPTGVRIEHFQQGSGSGFRAAMGIPDQAFIIGHLGRLAPEKNLSFLALAVADFMENDPLSHFLLVGTGPSSNSIHEFFESRGLAKRLHCVGVINQPLLASAYKSMDIFAFSSLSETQGMVLTEAMAAEVPVVALDAAGVREVVKNGTNGLLIPASLDPEPFTRALHEIRQMSRTSLARMKQQAFVTAEQFSLQRSVDKALVLYGKTLEQNFVFRDKESSTWKATLRLINTEWEMMKGMAEAAGAAFLSNEPGEIIRR